MTRDKDLVVAKYIPEHVKNGYLARIQIELRSKNGTRHDLDYTYPRPFIEMNDALAKCFQLVGRWQKKYAPDADIIVEPSP
jgi:hypothetical protein